MRATGIAGLLGSLVSDLRGRFPDRVPIIGVSGAQGAGKSYQCRKFVAANPRVAYFSLDDVYLTKAERVWRADNISSFNAVRDEDGNFQVTHVPRPDVERLLLTRGPPGTHDLALAKAVIERLREPSLSKLPRFDKAADDRAPESGWPVFQGPAEAILVDGWCLGATPPPPSEPLNDVEREDIDRIWRRETEAQLRKSYQPFFATFNAILYLKPPSWEAVQLWRAEQEAENLGRTLTPDDRARLDRFMQHYERITRSMMAGGHCANWVIEQDERRNAIGFREVRSG
ncbi:MAG: kinase [Terricaulis sp.]